MEREKRRSDFRVYKKLIYKKSKIRRGGVYPRPFFVSRQGNSNSILIFTFSNTCYNISMQNKKVFNGKYLQVYTSQKKLPDGRLSYFEEVKHPGASLVVPFDGEKIVFIRQYRGVIGKHIWELPAGTLDPGETPYSCAKREVTEETGYKVKNLKKIGQIHSVPGYSNEVITIYSAECTMKVKTDMDPDEVIKVRLFQKKEVRSLFKNGKITDAKTIAALAFVGII
jgi:ADP-ribose diphosphatase